MDDLSPLYLTELFAGIDVGSNFFLSFFPYTISHSQDLIAFDEKQDSLLITPYAHPRAEAPVIEKESYKARYLKPAYLKDKREFDPHDLSFRSFGENISANLSQDQRLELALTAALREQKEFFFRRLEQMACEIISSGKLSIVSDTLAYSVDFQRDPSLTVKLLEKDLWSSEKADIIEQIEDYSSRCLDKSSATINTIVMGKKAWNAFRKNKAVKDLLDTRRGDSSSISIAPDLIGKGISYKGLFGEYKVFVHMGKYSDPHLGQVKPFVSDTSVLLLSDHIEGTRHFGAIKDFKANLLSIPFFVKQIIKEDPSAMYLLAQSAPLLVPGRVNASMSLEVL
jgi:hypothetical protein